NMNHMNLMNGKIDTLDMNDRYNKPVKFIPPGI
ncbi:putative spindle assembly abnormal protein 6, partial [Plasmodium gaboni]